MKHKRFVVISIVGAVILIGALAVALVPRSITTSRSLSPQALAIISAPDSAAGVSPFDLQCSAKVPGGLMQCGSQASSCKNCHEVKGEDPVNSKGDWHTAHAFGDFCEFCHGGNVQATDKAAAHEGLVQPLGDIKTNCSSCHAQDYQTKAEVYATALGVTVGGSGGAAQPPASSTGTGATTPSQPAGSTPAEPAQQTAPQQVAPQPAASPALPVLASNEIVDYVAQYRAAEPLPPNTATTIISLLFVASCSGWRSLRPLE